MRQWHEFLNRVSVAGLQNWIRILLLLRLVSFLGGTLLLAPTLWIGDTATSLVALVFVLKLTWILLCRHVLPYREQDRIELLQVEAGRVVQRWKQQVDGLLHGARHHVRGAAENSSGHSHHPAPPEVRPRSAPETPLPSERDTGDNSILLARNSIKAPEVNEIERMGEPDKDEAGKEEAVPLLQDKKQW